MKTLQAQRTALENKVAGLDSKFVNLKQTRQSQVDDLQEEIDFQRKKTSSEDAEVQKFKSKEKEREKKSKEKEKGAGRLQKERKRSKSQRKDLKGKCGRLECGHEQFVASHENGKRAEAQKFELF